MRQRVLQDIQIKWSKCKIASSTVNYNKIKKNKKNHNMWFTLELYCKLPQYIDICQW
jgi:hypothetical protein